MPVRIQQQLLNCFVAGTTARAAARLVNVQTRTAVIFFQRLRQLVASKQKAFLLSEEMNADKRYGGCEQNVRQGRRAAKSKVVFGLIMRGNKVCTAIIPTVNALPQIPDVQETVSPDSIVYTDSGDTHNVLDVCELRHKCLRPSKTVLSKGGYHVDGIENFWNESRRYLRRFNGIPKQNLYWYLKECEWRFNGSDHLTLSKQLRDWYNAELNKS